MLNGQDLAGSEGRVVVELPAESPQSPAQLPFNVCRSLGPLGVEDAQRNELDGELKAHKLIITSCDGGQTYSECAG